MKVYSINVANQQFKGLWGDTRRKQLESQYYDGSQEIYVGNDHVLIEKDYYPFKDETPEQIEKVKKEFKASEAFDKEYDGLATAFEEHVVNIKKCIPLTAQKYKDYIERKLLSRAEMRVEDKLKIAGLQRFLR